MVSAPDARPEETVRPSSCLGRTCMKWSANGELTDLDLELILKRLIEVDEQASGLLD